MVVAQSQTGGVAWLEMGVSLGDGTWQAQSLLWSGEGSPLGTHLPTTGISPLPFPLFLLMFFIIVLTTI